MLCRFCQKQSRTGNPYVSIPIGSMPTETSRGPTLGWTKRSVFVSRRGGTHVMQRNQVVPLQLMKDTGGFAPGMKCRTAPECLDIGT